MATPISITTRESYPEPTVLAEFDQFYGTHVINQDGTETWYGRRHIVITLKKKVTTTEYRGFTSKPTAIDGAAIANTTTFASVAIYKPGTNNEVERTVAYPASATTWEVTRINEAGFWRAVKTETTATPVQA